MVWNIKYIQIHTQDLSLTHSFVSAHFNSRAHKKIDEVLTSEREEKNFKETLKDNFRASCEVSNSFFLHN